MEWQKENGITADWKTPEHINVKPVYTKEDLEGMEHFTPTPAAGGSGLWSTVNELKIKEKCTTKKAICIILAAVAAVAIIVSRRPRPRGRREI